MKNNKP